ncbi:MAG: ABC transporter ATP-binding protein [Acidimicrobiales bacterium]
MIVIALQAVQTMATLILPTLNADIIDQGIANQDTAYIVRMGGVMLGVTVVQIGFAIGATFFSAKIAMGFGRDVRSNLFHRVTSFSGQEVATLGAPSLIRASPTTSPRCRCSSSCHDDARGGADHGDRRCVHGRARGRPAVADPAGEHPGAVADRRQHDRADGPDVLQMQERIDRINQVLREQITGIRVVRAFVRASPTRSTASRWPTTTTRTSLRAGRLMAFLFPTVMLILNVSSAGALWFGSNRIGGGEMQIGALIAFLSYLVQILMSVMMASFVAVMVPAPPCAPNASRRCSTRHRRSPHRRPGDRAPPSGHPRPRPGRVPLPRRRRTRCCAVSRSPARPGQTTAIIGSTGSGKTTLVNLIPRLYDVTGGAVLVNGVDVRDLEPELLWERVAIVPQKPFLFSGTVASNLHHADPDATDDQLWAALEGGAGGRLRAGDARARPCRSLGAAPTSRAASASV